MATLKPFRALRPHPDEAQRICCLPYDVMNTEEARRMAEGNPISFLRVTRPELELEDDADPYAPSVYERGAANLRKLVEQGHLLREEKPCYMLYRLTMGRHTQLGLVAAASCKEYDEGTVKKHELTRPDKEDDRTRHINILGAQTGAVFLTYKASGEIDALFEELTAPDADYDFTADDGIRHAVWTIRNEADVARIEALFDSVPALYVADGHHRSAAASRVARERAASNPDHTGEEPYNYFLTVTFPHDQMQILGYNRAVRDLGEFTPSSLLVELSRVAEMEEAPADRLPREKGEATMYMLGEWRLLRWKDSIVKEAPDTVAALDVSILQNRILNPMLGIEDPRTDKRISFIGGIRGTAELERLVDSGQFAVAFAMYPTSVEELMAIADEDGLMPPKSTWFEPKLRDAVAVHLIED